MDDLIAQLERRTDLSPAQVEEAIEALLSPLQEDSTKAAFLKALHEKGESAEEISAFAQSILAHAVDPHLDATRVRGPLLDLCGTGGDKLDLFNISTTCMFILAAGGATVVKHGNRGVSSKCGGADVLEELGIRIDRQPPGFKRCVEEIGVGFLFAPDYHPAFKMIAPVRKILAAQGIPTIFNILGPLLNPARPAHQLVGIFSPKLLPKYVEALAKLGRKRAWAVHGSGMDELSTAGPTEVHEVHNGTVRQFVITGEATGLETTSVRHLRGGDRKENARILLAILDGSLRDAKRDVVLLNAGAAFVVAELAPDLPAGIALAREQIDTGRALEKLAALRRLS
jgi:anthranilate phosphoribosyltransferase